MAEKVAKLKKQVVPEDENMDKPTGRREGKAKGGRRRKEYSREHRPRPGKRKGGRDKNKGDTESKFS